MKKSSGILIRDVIGTSLAELNGFRADDQVQAVNGHSTASLKDAFNQLTLACGSGGVDVLVKRGAKLISVRLKM
jgi:S1-C subfamily serine protease